MWCVSLFFNLLFYFGFNIHLSIRDWKVSTSKLLSSDQFEFSLNYLSLSALGRAPIKQYFCHNKTLERSLVTHLQTILKTIWLFRRNGKNSFIFTNMIMSHLSSIQQLIVNSNKMLFCKNRTIERFFVTNFLNEFN